MRVTVVLMNDLIQSMGVMMVEVMGLMAMMIALMRWLWRGSEGNTDLPLPLPTYVNACVLEEPMIPQALVFVMLGPSAPVMKGLTWQAAAGVSATRTPLRFVAELRGEASGDPPPRVQPPAIPFAGFQE